MDPDDKFQAIKREEIKDRRARHGDLATCPECTMTVLVDPRIFPGRLVPHETGGTITECRAGGWYRCYACQDGPTAGRCEECRGKGFQPPVSGVSSDGQQISSNAPARPKES